LPSWTAPVVAVLILIEIVGDGRRALSPGPVLMAAFVLPVVLFVQRLHPMPRVLSFAYLLSILGASAGATRLISQMPKCQMPLSGEISACTIRPSAPPPQAGTGTKPEAVPSDSLDKSGQRDKTLNQKIFEFCRPFQSVFTALAA
jgi:hypothetical protein